MASSYPTGGPSNYYGNNPQDETYQDPPQFYNPHAPHETYDQSGYREPDLYLDEPSYTLPQGHSAEPLESNTKEEPDYVAEEFTPTPRNPVNPRSPRSLRAWRYQQGRRLWTQGSRPRCLCRFVCCTVLITIFLIASILLALALWIRPPNIVIGGNNGTSPAVAQGVNVLSDGFQVNMDIPIEVINPNFFSVKLTHVDAQLFYRINNTLIGNGTIHNVNLPSGSTTNFTFPFALVYTESIDPNSAIITDIASKCLGSPPSDLTINYKITVGVRVLMVTIAPTISNSLSFACPIDPTTLQGLIKSLGLSLSDLTGSGS